METHNPESRPPEPEKYNPWYKASGSAKRPAFRFGANCCHSHTQTLWNKYFKTVGEEKLQLSRARLCIPLDSGRIPTEVGQKSSSGKNVKVRSTGMCYNTILVLPAHSGWYLSTRFLQVEKAVLTLSKLKQVQKWEHGKVFSLVVQLAVCCWVCRECNNQPLTGAAKVMDGRDKSVMTHLKPS